MAAVALGKGSKYDPSIGGFIGVDEKTEKFVMKNIAFHRVKATINSDGSITLSKLSKEEVKKWLKKKKST